MKTRLKAILQFTVLVSLLLSFVGTQSAHAAGSWYVAPAGDDAGACLDAAHPCATIQAAVDKAASGDIVNVAVGVYTGSTTEAVVKIAKDLVISGGWNTDFSAQVGQSHIDGQGTRQGVHIISGIITINNFIIENCKSFSYGGGIFIYTGHVIVNNSIIKNNIASSGGGILNEGTIVLNNSVIWGNTADGSGIFNSNNLTLNNSTISSNTGSAAIYNIAGQVTINSSTIASNQGLGLLNIQGSVVIQNTILADNNTFDCENELDGYTGTVVSQGYNLIESYINCTLQNSDVKDVDASLGPLQDNGGSTYTHSLLPDSPAIDAGNPTGCTGSAGALLTDQRGFPRLGRCDIGAFERQSPLSGRMTVSSKVVLPGGHLVYQITLRNGGDTEIQDVTISDPLPAPLVYEEGSLDVSEGIGNVDSGTITWAGSISPQHEVVLAYGATVPTNTLPNTVLNNLSTIEGAGEIFTLSTSATVLSFTTFLPGIIKPFPGIVGHVYDNGANASNINLTNYLYYNTSWHNIGNNWVENDGRFIWDWAATLQPGQKYCVEFNNPSSSADGHLAAWVTRELTSYKDTDSVFIGAFDIADVSLISPGPYTYVSLPLTFRWTKRLASPTDSYQVEIFDLSGNADFITPPLGFVDSFTLTRLPPGFVKNQAYGWAVWILSPDGGFGLDFYYNPIAFTSNGVISPSIFQSTGPHKNSLVGRGEPGAGPVR